MFTTKIYGPPGTGKTTTLISTLKGHWDNGLDSARVAYLTFSRAAISEAISLTEKLSAENPMIEAVPTWFRTIHSACFKLLALDGNNLFNEKHRVLFYKETGVMLTENARFHEFMFSEGRADVIVQARATARAKGVTLWAALATAGREDLFVDACKVLEIYDNYKAERVLCDYVDVLTKYISDPDARTLADEGITVVFVDEAQDLSPLQWDIIKKMTQGIELLYLAGDDDQSIYNFIGADADVFNNFPCNRKVVLHQSHRVPRAVGRKAEEIITTLPTRMPKEIVWRDFEGELVYSNDRNPSDLPFRPNTQYGTFILCRHQSQVRRMSESLDHIPHDAGGVSQVTGRLAEVYNSHARVYRGESIDAGQMRQLMRYLNIKWAAGSQTSFALEDFSEKVPEVLEGRDLKERDTFKALSTYVDLYGLDVLCKEPWLKIMTMHASKGKQADDVFILPDVFNTVYKHRNSAAEKRVMYVALTRARERAIIMPSTTRLFYTGLY